MVTEVCITFTEFDTNCILRQDNYKNISLETYHWSVTCMKTGSVYCHECLSHLDKLLAIFKKESEGITSKLYQ